MGIINFDDSYDIRIYEFFSALSITASQMTMINDKIMRDKEASIAAIFEAEVAMCENV